jgi:hypothetical protein
MPKRKEYTDDQIRQWYAEYEAGATIADLTAAHGIAKSTFRRHCQALGLKLRHAGRKSPMDTYLAIVDARARGDKLSVIGSRYHLTRQRVSQVVKMFRVPLRNWGDEQ